MKNLRYDVIYAAIVDGVKLHPCDDMIKLGYRILKSEAVPVADCWWFRVESDIDSRPDYIHVLSDGFKFSDEYASMSREEGFSSRQPPEYKDDGMFTDYGKYVRGLTDFRRQTNESALDSAL